MSLSAVLFDAGNTLVALDYPRLAARVGEVTGVPLTTELLVSQAGEAALVMERQDGTDRERASRYLETLFRLSGVPAGQWDLVRDTLYALHREKHLWSGVDPRTGPALDRLLAAGLRLAVISNSDGRAEEALAAADLLPRFEFVIDSQLIGVEKPDPRIFEAALERMALPAADALYVGDLYEIDVVGARRAGMDAILLDPLGKHGGRDVRTAASVSAVADLLLSPVPTRVT